MKDLETLHDVSRKQQTPQGFKKVYQKTEKTMVNQNETLNWCQNLKSSLAAYNLGWILASSKYRRRQQENNLLPPGCLNSPPVNGYCTVQRTAMEYILSYSISYLKINAVWLCPRWLGTGTYIHWKKAKWPKSSMKYHILEGKYCQISLFSTSQMS